MTPVAAMSMDLLWHNALGAIPLAIVVLVIGRFVRCRPSTRHAMWLIVLLSLLAPPLVPSLDFSDDLGSPQFFASMRAKEVEEDAKTQATREVTSAESSTLAPSTPTRKSPPKPQFDQPAPFSYWNSQSLTPESAASTASEGSPDPLRRPASHPDPSSAAVSVPASIVPECDGNVESCKEKESGDKANSNTFAVVTIPWLKLPLLAWSEKASVAPASSNVATSRDVPPPSVALAVQPSDSAVTMLAPAPSGSPYYFAVNAAIEWREWLYRVAAARDSMVSLAPIPGSLWAAGVAVIVLVMLIRVWRFRRILRRAVPAPDDVVDVVRDSADAIGLRSIPRVLMTKRQISPLVWCGIDRVLLLPEPLWRDLDDTGRRAVLLHELAHVKRRDHWVCWIEMIACTVYWWNPMAWWVRHRLRDEADYCCDAWVTAVLPGSRTAYARALLTTRQYLNLNPSRTDTPSLALGATSARTKRFARRLTMVMTERTAPRLSMSGTALALLLAGGVWLATPLWACPPEESSGGPSAQAAAKAEKAAQATAVKTAKAAQEKAAKAEKDAHALVTAGHEKAAKAMQDVHGVTVPHVVVTPSGEIAAVTVAPAQGSTFEQHMADRHVAPNGAIAQAAPPSGQSRRATTVAPRGGGGQGGGDLEGRISRLEERMDRLTAHLEALLGGGGAPGGADAFPSAPGMPGAHAGPRGALAPTAPAPPQPPPAPQAPRARAVRPGVSAAAPMTPRTPPPGGAGLGGGMSRNAAPEPADTGEEIVRFYELPQEKAEALFEFMRRDDVPVMVAQRDGGIEVHGTAQQHRIFAAFVKLIHPEATIEDVSLVPNVIREGELPAREQAMARREVEAAGRAREGAIREREAVERTRENSLRQREQVQNRARDVRAQLEQTRKAQADELRRAGDQQRKQIEQQRQQIEKQREQMKKEIEGLQRKSEEMQKKAEQLRAKAEALDDGAEKDQLEAQADAVEAEADTIEAQADAQEEQIEAQLDAAIEGLEAHQEAMEAELESRAEALEAQLEAQQEAMEAELEAVLAAMEVEAETLPEPAEAPSAPGTPR